MALPELTTIVQLVLINDTGDSYYRMRWPGALLAQQDPSWRIINLDARARERFALALHSDLLVLYQSNDIDMVPIIEERRKQGKQTLVEYNDNFYAPPKSSPVADEWSSPIIWQTYESIMSVSDAVIVTGPGLEKLFSARCNKSIHILENQLPQAPPPFDKTWTDPTDELRIGWGGSIGHMADFLSITPMLEELAKKNETLKIHIMGNEALRENIRIADSSLRFTPWGSMAQYYAFLRPLHIGVVPLLDTPYNRCRSDVKAIELASLGVLPILPDAIPYKKFIKETGIKSYKTLAQLKKILTGYIAAPESIREDAKLCYDYVAKERVGIDRTERYELYQQYLPETRSQHRWPVSAGYYEISGTPNPEPSANAIMQQAQQQLKEGKIAEGRQLLAATTARNPKDATLRLSWIKFLRASKDQSLSAELKKAFKDFPDDLRFKILEIVYAESENNRSKLWREIIQRLRASEAEVKDFYQSDFVKLYSRDIQQTPKLLEIGKEILEIFQNSAALRFTLAQAYERSGNDKEALTLYRWLIKEHAGFRHNQEFLSNVKSNYLEVWEQALKHRAKRTKSKQGN